MCAENKSDRKTKQGTVWLAWSLLVVNLLIGGSAHAQVVSINYPGATATLLNGINNKGEAVGSYNDVLGRSHGFLYSNGVYSTLDYPGASSTSLHGINDDGVIVGIYSLPSDIGGCHGLRYSTILKSFQSINFPGSACTVMNGINNAGVMAGHSYVSSIFNTFIVRDGNTFEIITNSIDFLALGINDNDVVVGGAVFPPYPYSIAAMGTSDHVSYYDIPGYILTFFGINNDNRIVGTLGVPSSGIYSGFLKMNGQHIIQSVPNSRMTFFTDINDLGQIVGWADTVTNGFIGFMTTVSQVVEQGTILADNGADFYTLPPCRLIDTRLNPGDLAGPALQPRETRVFALTGVCGLPSSARAVAVNITVTDPVSAGSLSIVPGDAAVTTTSAINFRPGAGRANNGILKLSLDGSGAVAVYNSSSGTVQLVLDVNGYFQ